MKGIVFTEFIEMVENEFSIEIADQIIEASHLESEGVYTSLGTYNHEEMVQLVQQLSVVTNMPVPDLLQVFGTYLFGCFVDGFPQFFKNINSTFVFLEHVESYIHIEVLKLYPEAELPHFEYRYPHPNELEMTYHSVRPFAHFAKGLLQGAVTHFSEDIVIQHDDLSAGAGTSARFILTKKD